MLSESDVNSIFAVRHQISEIKAVLLYVGVLHPSFLELARNGGRNDITAFLSSPVALSSKFLGSVELTRTCYF
jgi:hypothetical protein